MRHRHLTRGATSLDAALVGAGVATPPLARLGRQLRDADLGPHDAFGSDLRAQLLNATSAPVPASSRHRERAAEGNGRSLARFATRLTAGIAAARLSEVHSLLNRAGLTSPAADLSTGACELVQSLLARRQGASLTTLAVFTSHQETALMSVLPALPAPAAGVSLTVPHAVAAQTTALLAEPASPNGSANPELSVTQTPNPEPSGRPSASPTPGATTARPTPSATAP